ncbi:MAG: V-type ATP synthase subunit F [Clostridiales bacterium]|jgi:V/A-type H+-transporting ATPase subunit F|nr:V-type ATP synthase subunit F [Clostridiales bacterium]
MYKIAVLGDHDSVYGFAAVGLDVFFAEEGPAAARRLRELVDGGYAVIYITESLFKFLEKDVSNYSEKAIPAIIPIPGASGNTGLGIERVRKSVERAVGSDMLFGASEAGKGETV